MNCVFPGAYCYSSCDGTRVGLPRDSPDYTESENGAIVRGSGDTGGAGVLCTLYTLPVQTTWHG